MGFSHYDHFLVTFRVIFFFYFKVSTCPILASFYTFIPFYGKIAPLRQVLVFLKMSFFELGCSAVEGPTVQPSPVSTVVIDVIDVDLLHRNGYLVNYNTPKINSKLFFFFLRQAKLLD